MSGLQNFLTPFSHLVFANRDKVILLLGLLLAWFTVWLLVTRWRNMSPTPRLSKRLPSRAEEHSRPSRAAAPTPATSAPRCRKPAWPHRFTRRRPLPAGRQTQVQRSQTRASRRTLLLKTSPGLPRPRHRDRLGAAIRLAPDVGCPVRHRLQSPSINLSPHRKRPCPSRLPRHPASLGLTDRPWARRSRHPASHR